MNTAFYTAGVSMLQHQKALDVVANNFANINTTGFKGSRANFADLIYTQQNLRPPQDNTIGHGAKIGRVQLMFEVGTPQATELTTDFYAPGNSLFGVQSPDGEEAFYTRNGAFQLQNSDDGLALITSDGFSVLDTEGSPIFLEKNADESIDYTPLMTIGLYAFNNPPGLEQLGNSNFRETALSGEPTQVRDDGFKPLQGYIEGSNVSMATEMTRMMITQRAFQFNSKILQAADEVEQIVNNLRA